MNRVAMIALVPLFLATPALAMQDHSQHGNMPGMTMPAQPQPKANAKPRPKAPPSKPKKAATKSPAAPQATSHSAHQAVPAENKSQTSQANSVQQEMPPKDGEAHAGHDMSEMSMSGMNHDNEEASAEVEIPQTPPPPPATDHLADRYFDSAQMAEARHMVHMEHGAMNLSNVMFDRLELRPDDGGYAWDTEFRYGGDIHRLVVKSEGEGSNEDGVEDAEVQILYSRAITPYFDIQAGIRQDFEPQPRTYLTLGTEGIFPYWFDVEGAVFLSNEGELLARAKGTYDLRLTQRMILQPSAEVTFSAQDIPELEIGSGLSSVELGLRLRYEIRREFAPYIGIVYERKFGDAADFVRLSGKNPESTKVVIGLRAWF
ncbi:copper resistance protein B [Asticcacaulis biprosthecium C19]|uniref:Copper resistance protein B n=1 Tax=Asticcacaulis biprosthecium C19 TaxID=715226 RepID=F4QFW9_9CAUL|nr:copper resistance protein B [Asticcacaulis biprosthecium]EGF93780.1 copper resistance protein B [Asticcacaulis biprosthecium C19]